MKCLLEGCNNPISENKRGRPQRFCCDAHRKAHSRLNGQSGAPVASVPPLEQKEKSYWTVASAGKPLSEIEKAALLLSGFIEIEPPQRARPATVKPPTEFHHGPTPGALPGNYPLEYYPDGYPKLPPCLDRRRKVELREAA